MATGRALKIVRLLQPLALAYKFLGVYYLNKFKNRTFFTLVPIFCYLLLCTYSLTADFERIHRFLSLFLVYTTFNNVILVVMMSYNREKIWKLIDDMAEVVDYSEKIGVEHNYEKTFRSFENLVCFVLKCSVGLSFFLVSYVPFSCRLLMVFTYLNNATTQLNACTFLNFSAHFFKQLKKATAAYGRESKSASLSAIKRQLSCFRRLHLKIFVLANAVHGLFYVPMLVALTTKCIYLFLSPVVCYFSIVDVLARGYNSNNSVTVMVSILVIVSATLTSFNLADCYEYNSSKANAFAMALLNAHALRCHGQLDDYIQECTLQLSHRKLRFAVEKICFIDRELIYSGLGSIISVLLVVVQYHETQQI